MQSNLTAAHYHGYPRLHLSKEDQRNGDILPHAINGGKMPPIPSETATCWEL
jgi:hypothetical protein